MHKVARVKIWDSIQLYVSTTFGGFFLKPYSHEGKLKARKLSKMMEIGKEKIECQLNIVKIIKNLRHMKILLKSSLMNPEINHKIMHSKKNVINLSSEEEYVSDCCSSEEIVGEIKSPKSP